MTTVVLNEEQFNRLFLIEGDDDDVILDGNDDIKQLGDDAKTSPDAAIITGKDGDKIMGKPVDSEEWPMVNQTYWRMVKRF